MYCWIRQSASFYKMKKGHEEILAAILEDQLANTPIAESSIFSLIKTDTNEITSQRA